MKTYWCNPVYFSGEASLSRDHFSMATAEVPGFRVALAVLLPHFRAKSGISCLSLKRS